MLDGTGVSIAGRANLDSGGSGEEEFDGVFRSADASHADDRDFDGLRGFPDHADCNGLDSWAGEAPGDVAEAGAAGFNVNGERDESVDEGDGVSAGGFRAAGHAGDGCDVGREFDDERAARVMAGMSDEVRKCGLVDPEGDAAGMGVGSGDIELVGGDAFGLVEAADDRDVVL